MGLLRVNILAPSSVHQCVHREITFTGFGEFTGVNWFCHWLTTLCWHL